MREVKNGSTMVVPTRLSISIGGFGGRHYEVRWQRGRLWYRTDDAQVKVAPSAQDWETFWTAINKIEAWNWRPSYDNPEILDGTQWSLDLNDGARRVRCFGSNAYPEAFQEFLAAVGALVRQPFGT